MLEAEYDEAYKYILLNREASHHEWQWELLADHVAKAHGSESARQARAAHGEDWSGMVADAALANADRVFRTAAVSGGAKAKRQATLDRSKAERNVVFVHPDEDVDGFYILNGEQILFYAKKVKRIDGVNVAANVLTDVWSDIGWTGIAREGGVKLKNGKKPEKLLRRVLDLYSEPGSLVLDFFSGSGTTAAVAHKMGRRWIAVEQLDYGENSTRQRLSNVIEGDRSGISKAVEWRGGGSFVSCELAEYNEAFGRRVRDAEDEAALEQAIAAIRAGGYWRYKADHSSWDWDAFAELTLDERKAILLESLDANHLYVNLGDLGDPAYGIGEREIAINKAFYEGRA